MNPILAISIGIGVDGATSEQILAGRLHLVPDLFELRNECLVVFFGACGGDILHIASSQTVRLWARERGDPPQRSQGVRVGVMM